MFSYQLISGVKQCLDDDDDDDDEDESRRYIRHGLIDVFDAVTHCKLVDNFLCDAVEVNLPRLILFHSTTSTSQPIYHTADDPF